MVFEEHLKVPQDQGPEDDQHEETEDHIYDVLVVVRHTCDIDDALELIISPECEHLGELQVNPVTCKPLRKI